MGLELHGVEWGFCFSFNCWTKNVHMDKSLLDYVEAWSKKILVHSITVPIPGFAPIVDASAEMVGVSVGQNMVSSSMATFIARCLLTLAYYPEVVTLVYPLK